MSLAPKLILGVDEAGRAPLAGPVAVGFVAVPSGFEVAKEFPGVKDSKQLTELAREKIFTMLEGRAKRGDVRFCVRFGTHGEIDERGITIAVRRAIRKGVLALAPDPVLVEKVYLDGLLFAPYGYPQETVIHGDDRIPIISLASIAAKVSRDRLMKKYAKRFPLYGFEKHKGYPTELHYEMIKRHGPCVIHRRSYIHVDLTQVREYNKEV